MRLQVMSRDQYWPLKPGSDDIRPDYPKLASESLYASTSGVFELLQVCIILGKASYMTGSDLM